MLRGMKQPDKTRARLIEAAFAVIYRKGFKAASLSDILADTGLTKGALYHHFPNKKALGLALLDSIEQAIELLWLQPLADSDNPLATLKLTMLEAIAQLDDTERVQGCPLNNLAQEMATLDEDFRLRVAKIYQRWLAGVAEALKRGQQAGSVRSDMDAAIAADFYVAALAGARGLAKSLASAEKLDNCARALGWFLDGLQAVPSGTA